jgi:aryl-alcohol dehydrogenase-like predicted oxidoreductase
MGIRTLDTAPAYGESEAVLGRLAEVCAPFRIVTKTPKLAVGAGGSAPVVAKALEEGLQASLRRLASGKVYALLFHQASDLMGRHGDCLMDKARECQARGWVEKVGVSVYDSGQIDAVMDRHGADIVQVPLNVFDQRLIASGHLAALKRAGTEVHARSIFLQGLLLMEPDSLPAGLAAARAPLEAFRAAASARDLSFLEAAVGFATGIPEVDVVLCGVNDAAQLEAICAAARPLPADGFRELAVGDVDILNPSRWEKRR